MEHNNSYNQSTLLTKDNILAVASSYLVYQIGEYLVVVVF